MTGPVRIRMLQHYLYCPHRWGLIEIDEAWAENYFVARANLLHEHVHETGSSLLRGRTRSTAVSVWNAKPEYMLYGIVDCLERDRDGLCIVEYKPTQSRSGMFNDDDALQVFAQKISVDDIFHTDCRAELYYSNTRKRVKLPFDENADKYREMLMAALREIRTNTRDGTIPPVQKGQKCGGCSLKDICMPKRKSNSTTRERILRGMEAQV